MRELVYSDSQLCLGCNRCTRSCPVELANITTLHDDGTTKVNIDHSKCIACGACISACRHGARGYYDDTERFLQDLRAGQAISLIVAPALRSNMPNAGRLLTWLRDLGVKLIYDVSLGADICTWAHIRYIQKNNPSSLITQPCPVIVNYCLMYRPQLLRYLSPVHSPMLCTAVYMKHYQGVNTRIAAISPCVAKSHEFDSTGLVHYNVTFKKLFEYIEQHRIPLPREESGFDHDPSGLGSVYSMPGGLKENVEFFIGKELRIDKSEGQNVVYRALDSFAKQSASYLPAVFDVLNCPEGCNSGTGCLHRQSIFEIGTAMEQARKAASHGRKKSYFEKLYSKYDKAFRLEDFLRSYTAEAVHQPNLSTADIDKAFLLMDKDTEAKRMIDCGACGSETCQDMARKIALHVNIPENCLQRNRDEIHTEHTELLYLQRMNMQNLTQIALDIDSIRNHVDTIATSITAVNASISDYDSMAKTISNIASQIGFISLSASIEAARAGVHGNVFSVIASEIQSLATLSKEALSRSSDVTSAAHQSVQEMNSSMSEIMMAVGTAQENIQQINESQRQHLGEK